MSVYPNVVRYLQEHPWAILPERLELIVAIVSERASGLRPTEDEIRARLEAAGPKRPAPPPAGKGIAVIRVHGVLENRMSQFDDISRGTSLQVLRKELQAAIEDPQIGAVILDIDSPGGSVHGLLELADAVYAARETGKPIVAVANSMAASAAYWIGSQASEFVASPSAEVGSIGVVAVHDDVSKMAEMEGLARTFITAGKFKAEANGFQPLGDEARAAIQATVDAYYDHFVKAVARGRGVAQRDVRAGFGEGRLVMAEAAMKEGMVDHIETMEAVIERMHQRLARRRPGASASATGTLEQEKRRMKTAVAPARGEADASAGPETDVEVVVDASKAEATLDAMTERVKALEGRLVEADARIKAADAKAAEAQRNADEKEWLAISTGIPPAVREPLKALWIEPSNRAHATALLEAVKTSGVGALLERKTAEQPKERDAQAEALAQAQKRAAAEVEFHRKDAAVKSVEFTNPEKTSYQIVTKDGRTLPVSIPVKE